jgi:hypothetical protein
MKLNPAWKLLRVEFPRVQPSGHCYSCSPEKLSFRILADDADIFFTGSYPKEVEFTMNEEVKLVLKILCY